SRVSRRGGVTTGGVSHYTPARRSHESRAFADSAPRAGPTHSPLSGPPVARDRSGRELEARPGVDQLAVPERIDGQRSLDVELHEHGLAVLAEHDALSRF